MAYFCIIYVTRFVQQILRISRFEFKECDGENVNQAGNLAAGNVPGGRTITLQMLLSAGILHAGLGTMTIEYLVSFVVHVLVHSTFIMV